MPHARRLSAMLASIVCLVGTSVSMSCAPAAAAPAGSPVGAVDSAAWVSSQVVMRGWSFDRDALSTPQRVRIYQMAPTRRYVGQTLTTRTRSDVNRSYGVRGAHGWQIGFASRPGTFTFCAYAINVGAGSNSRLGCRTIRVPVRVVPQGHVDAAAVTTDASTASGFLARMSGWAFDRGHLNHPQQVQLRMYPVEDRNHFTPGQLIATTSTTQLRPDVNRAYKISGAHGWTTRFEMPPGQFEFCSYVTDAGGSRRTLLGCRQLATPKIARAWGYNRVGQLGDQTNTWHSTPTPSYAPVDVKQVAGDALAANVMLSGNGTVWMVGWGPFGEMGRGFLNDASRTPVQVPGLTSVTKISVSSHGYGTVYALRSDGSVWGWGLNDSGQLGDGTQQDRAVPQLVPGLANVVDIAASVDGGSAVKSDGTVWNWGFRPPPWGAVPQQNTSFNDAQAVAGKWVLTRDRVVRNTSHVAVGGMTDIQSIVSSTSGTVYGLRSDGTVWAAGNNDWGQLGVADTSAHSGAVQVQIPTKVVSLAAGAASGYALDSNGTIWSWGDDDAGELGHGTTTQNGCLCVPTPTTVVGTYKTIGAGGHTAFALPG